MALSATFPAFPCNKTCSLSRHGLARRSKLPTFSSGTWRSAPICAKLKEKTALEYRKLGDSDLNISEITLGTMTFGEQNTEKEAHEMLIYAFGHAINALDTAEAYPIPMKKETKGKTDLYIASRLKSQSRDKVIMATKVCGYTERFLSYLRDNTNVLRVDAVNIRESVENSLKRLNTDYIDLLQIHWTDHYVPSFGEFFYDPSRWRLSIPFVEQLKAFQELIDEGKERYIGVSNESSYGVMEFVHAAKVEGLPKIQGTFEKVDLNFHHQFLMVGKGLVDAGAINLLKVDLVEVCHPDNCNIGLLAYSPLGGGALTGKYLDINSEAAKRGRLNLFPGYMERYDRSTTKEAIIEYTKVAKKHGLIPVQIALGFARDRPFVTSSIVGATSIDQLKEDIDAFMTTERPLPAEVMTDIETTFKRYKDPAIL